MGGLNNERRASARSIARGAGRSGGARSGDDTTGDKTRTKGRGEGGGNGPPGTIIRPSTRGPQVVRQTGSRWTDESERIFLDELGATCNVERAARAAGFCNATAYRRRATDPGFAELWRVALAQGFDRLEMLLIQRATELLEGRLPNPDHPIPPMTVAEVIRILQVHRASVRDTGERRPGRPFPPRSLDQMRASIIAKLEAIEAHERIEGESGGDADR